MRIGVAWLNGFSSRVLIKELLVTFVALKYSKWSTSKNLFLALNISSSFFRARERNGENLSVHFQECRALTRSVSAYWRLDIFSYLCDQPCAPQTHHFIYVWSVYQKHQARFIHSHIYILLNVFSQNKLGIFLPVSQRGYHSITMLVLFGWIVIGDWITTLNLAYIIVTSSNMRECRHTNFQPQESGQKFGKNVNPDMYMRHSEMQWRGPVQSVKR